MGKQKYAESVVGEWVDSLTNGQVRALGHQAGYAWDGDVELLRKRLKEDSSTEEIYEAHYGE